MTKSQVPVSLKSWTMLSPDNDSCFLRRIAVIYLEKVPAGIGDLMGTIMDDIHAKDA